MPIFCCRALPGLTMNVLVWGKENSYFWKIHSLGMCFGQDPVSMNMPKAEILINSCEEEDWTLLLHPQRIALRRVCPRGRGLAWARAGETRLVRAVSVGQDAAEMHNRLDSQCWKASASRAQVPSSLSVNWETSPSSLSGLPASAAFKTHESIVDKPWLWIKSHEAGIHTCFSFTTLWACNYLQVLPSSFPVQA